MCIFLLFVVPVNGQKDNKEKLQLQKVRLEDEIKLANVILREMREDRKESISSLEALGQKLRIREQLLRTLNRELKLLEEDLQAQQGQLKELEQQLELQKQVYADMIRKAYSNRDQHTVLMFILSSQDFFQAVKRVQYLKQIAKARQKQIERIAETQFAIESEQESIRKKVKEKEAVIERQRREKEILLKEKKEQESQLASFSGKEKEIQEDIKKKQQQRDQLNQEIQRLIAIEIKRAKEEALRKQIEDEAKSVGLVKNKDFTSKTTNQQLKTLITKAREAKAAAGKATEAPVERLPELSAESQLLAANFSANKKKLPWPVDRGLVIAKFGPQSHAVAKGVVWDNKGIDIASEKGSKAKAVFEGEVISILRIPGANKAVLVRHGNYFTVYSNLTEIYVKQNDKIKVGQTIGLIFTDDENGKTVLHFEIWKDTEVMDPQGWLQ
ncbi:MAG: peptidoglycan DD-metalloendopeptidase family protein [Cryomorphaceae bacterium]|nr:peptidoglycan DD-metalloendopeptidase family protein [Cryomorphaceae bacterium]